MNEIDPRIFAEAAGLLQAQWDLEREIALTYSAIWANGGSIACMLLAMVAQGLRRRLYSFRQAESGRPPQAAGSIRTGLIICALLAIFIAPVTLWEAAPYLSSKKADPMPGLFMLLGVIFALHVLWYELFRRGTHHAGTLPQEGTSRQGMMFPNDGILYLRAFDLDDHQVEEPGIVPIGTSFEKAFLRLFSVPKGVYALRGHASHMDGDMVLLEQRGAPWQDFVTDALDRAGVIVILLWNSPGIKWELQQLCAAGHLAKTVMVFPPVDGLHKARLFEEVVGLLGIEPNDSWRGIGAKLRSSQEEDPSPLHGIRFTGETPELVSSKYSGAVGYEQLAAALRSRANGLKSDIAAGSGVDQIFVQSGLDLAVRLPVRSRLAESGGQVRVPRLDRASHCVMRVPPGTRDGSRLRLKGMGAGSAAAGSAGDLYAVLQLYNERPAASHIEEQIDRIKAWLEQDIEID